jgi:hypothetical protein
MSSLQSLLDDVKYQVDEQRLYEGRMVSFPSGVPLGVDGMSISFEQKGHGRKRRRVIEGDLSGLKFYGNDFDAGVSSNKNLCKYAIGKLNHDSKMTLYPVDHVFVMRPILNSEHKPEHVNKMTPQQRRGELIEEFGSSKKKRAVKQEEANIIQDSTVRGASTLTNALKEAEVGGETGTQYEALAMGTKNGAQLIAKSIDALQSEKDKALEAARLLILPKYDSKATEAKNVYPISEFLQTEIKEGLESLYDLCLDGETFEETKYKKICGIASDKLLSFCFSGNSAKAFRCTRNGCDLLEDYLLKYVNDESLNKEKKKKKIVKYHREKTLVILLQYSMIHFYNIVRKHPGRSMLLSQLVENLSVPEPVSDYLVKKFTEVKKKKGIDNVETPKTLVDRLLAHILALGLHTSQFSFNISALSEDMTVSEAILSRVARSMGLKIVKKAVADSRKSIACVEFNTVPISFPAPSRGKK